MNFKEIKEKDLNSLQNKDTQLIANMKPEERKKYLTFYVLYRNLFTEYIIKKLNLKEVDQQIEKSNLNFVKTDEKNMDLYQYCSSDELKYFYIRNNIYINNLDDEEKDFLTQKIKDNNIELDENAKYFIEATYKKVIYEGISDEDRGYIRTYGPDSKNFAAPNNALVIGVRYDDFNLNGLTDEKWKDLYFKQIDFLTKLVKNMEKQFNETIDIPVKIIKYTDFSVIRREPNE